MKESGLKTSPNLTFADLARLLPELYQVEENLHQAVASAEGPVAEMCSRVLRSGGKRLRPMLVLAAGKCFGPVSPGMIKVAVAVELIHMASLIHDDVIDVSSTRRGRPTLNACWGNRVSILTGDFLFAKAFRLLVENQLFDVLRLVTRTVEDMCEGEVEQVIGEFDINQTEENYFSRIRKKTANLIAMCCQAGALIAEKDQEKVEALYEYGLNLGCAFQIIDDILDFIGKPEQLGKPAGLDLAQGNLTLPVLALLRDPFHRSWLQKELLQDKMDGELRQRIVEAVISSGALAYARAVASYYQKKAKQALAVLPVSQYRNLLMNLAELVLVRSN
ncbi:polyprenyl synthetase family protein [Calderihabitans maritimus]|uniref:Polyprenyl synthetase family protein n=1 Tax=Calderihabitans maritimus TaxID=1246530 RepID=A0A1Z5HNJ0_9FIRM|nr:polyprenyl synthetase family protein [Calderihabitans maritimus]GAW90865.1 polyprenyl synthetase family protein [Calderihabitans maritimus]